MTILPKEEGPAIEIGLLGVDEFFGILFPQFGVYILDIHSCEYIPKTVLIDIFKVAISIIVVIFFVLFPDEFLSVEYEPWSETDNNFPSETLEHPFWFYDCDWEVIDDGLNSEI